MTTTKLCANTACRRPYERPAGMVLSKWEQRQACCSRCARVIGGMHTRLWEREQLELACRLNGQRTPWREIWLAVTGGKHSSPDALRLAAAKFRKLAGWAEYVKLTKPEPPIVVDIRAARPLSQPTGWQRRLLACEPEAARHLIEWRA